MTSLLWLGAGGLAAYLLLRHKPAAAATAAPAALAGAPASPTPQAPAPSPPAIVVVNAPAAGAPKPAPSAKPPQIMTSTPPVTGEVAQPKPATIVQLAGRWGWPVPRYEGRAPVISDGFGSPRPPGKHMGVDLMFARISSDRFPLGPNASKAFVMPDAWMAVAASDGVLWSAGRTPRGYAVVVDHGNVATFYQHLDTLFVPEVKAPAKGAPRFTLIPIKAGQPLGVIGGDPLDPNRLKHLHFELWAGGPTNAVDPAPLMRSWQVFTPSDIAAFFPSLTRNAAKKSGKRSDLVPVRGHERRWPGTALHPPR
jgi:murein DD-endopeptidase MepM/ murein hydrolase activator NlpD